MKTMNPRKPTRKELFDLAAFIAKETGDTPEEMANRLKESALVVFDNYVTAAPGFVGKIIIYISDYDPARSETYTWEDGEIRRIEPAA